MQRTIAILLAAICLSSTGCHVCSPQCNLRTGWHWSPFWRGAPCEVVTKLDCNGQGCGDGSCVSCLAGPSMDAGYGYAAGPGSVVEGYAGPVYGAGVPVEMSSDGYMVEDGRGTYSGGTHFETPPPMSPYSSMPFDNRATASDGRSWMGKISDRMPWNRNAGSIQRGHGGSTFGADASQGFSAAGFANPGANPMMHPGQPQSGMPTARVPGATYPLPRR